MKKLIIIILGIALIIGLTYFAIDLNKSSKATDVNLIAFSVKDTSSVDKIEIYDSYKDMKYALLRGDDGNWKGEDGACVQQHIVTMMLNTMKNITLKGYVPKSAMKNMKKLMMSQYKEVKIYQDGEWAKTWYVGHSTKNQTGTHMLLETPDMKSDNPVIMGMKGFTGILGPRFFADSRRFTCTDLFSIPRKSIRSVRVINRVTPSESFEIKINKSSQIDVQSNGKTVQDINQDNLLFYLNGFEDIHFNQPNYTLSQKKIDSITSNSADYELTIQSNQAPVHLKMYRRFDPQYKGRDTVAYDQSYLWGVNNDEDIVRLQYYSIGPLIQGKTVFVEQ